MSSCLPIPQTCCVTGSQGAPSVPHTKYQVTATNNVGTGAASATTSAICAGVPAKMSPAMRRSATRSSVVVSWFPSQGFANNGGASLLSYRLYMSTMGSDFFNLIYAGTALQHAQFGLRGGTEYIFYVTAVNEVGESESSESVVIMAATVPGPPRQVDFSVGSRHKTELSWTALSDDGGFPLTRYTVSAAVVLSGFVDNYQPVWQGSFGPNDKIVTSSISLCSGNIQRFYVVVFNVISDKYTIASMVEKSQTVDWWAAVGLSAPVVSATVSDLTSIIVSWTAPTDNGGIETSCNT